MATEITLTITKQTPPPSTPLKIFDLSLTEFTLTKVLLNSTFKTYFKISNGTGDAPDDDIEDATYLIFGEDIELDFTGATEEKEFKIDKILKTNNSKTLTLLGDVNSTIEFDNVKSGCSISSGEGIIYFKSGTYKFINDAKFYSLDSSPTLNLSGCYKFEDDTVLDIDDADFILKTLKSILINYKVDNKDTTKDILDYIYYLKQSVSDNSNNSNIINDLTDTNKQLRKLICALCYPVSKKSAYPNDGII